MPEDDVQLELYSRYVRVMLSSVETLSESCRQLHKPVPYELEVKQHYLLLAQKQLQLKDVKSCRSVLAEMKMFLEQ